MERRARALQLGGLAVAMAIPRLLATSCEEVWFTLAEIQGAEVTCGERIGFLQSPQGGFLTENEARAQVSLEVPGCEACWPWEKFREPGLSSRSAKRGIAIESFRLTKAALIGLASIVSWGCTWDYKVAGDPGPGLEDWEAAGIEFIPMIWGSDTIPLAAASGLPNRSLALLGFNEPNFPSQSKLEPWEAASFWPSLEQLASDHGITEIISPSMNYHPDKDPVQWLEEFFAICDPMGCKVDGIAMHVFACYGAGLKAHLDRYRKFGKPLWVTEIACSDPYTPERLSAEGQMAYMKEAVPLLEQDPDVKMYAWFSYFKDQWAHPIVDGLNGDAGLVNPDGTLSPLGALYDTFAHTNLT
ncbi:unnamed protein product, partial [Polarella glacialis]